jgi:cytochrome c oxidase subunit 4
MLRDDLIEYSLDSHHSEEAGKKIRKKIFLVTILLTSITIIEVLLCI